jgi:hypothetical protein
VLEAMRRSLKTYRPGRKAPSLDLELARVEGLAVRRQIQFVPDAKIGRAVVGAVAPQLDKSR